jgi:tetrahydromethanopterin S-methyltransferase subunit D
MNKRKNTLQKVSKVIGIICFLLAILCAVILYFKVQELGMQHVVSASWLASSFFFAFIGVVFIVIGNADIPSFKIIGTAPPAPLKEEKSKD